MDGLTQKISEFLLTNPNSSAREIGKEIGISKNDVNSCLYANEGIHFLKVGSSPPLWRNIEQIPKTEPDEPEVEVLNDSYLDDFQSETNDSSGSIYEENIWTGINSEDQKIYLQLKARTSRGEFLSKPDRRLMNILQNRIRQAERGVESFDERRDRRAKTKLENRAKYFAMVDEKVNEIWSADDQRQYAIEALSLQFESNLRKLAYGYLISRNEKIFEQETENEIEIRQAKGREQVEAVSASIDGRLSNLESSSDKDLISSTVRFAWINRGQTSRPQAISAIEMLPQFEEKDEVKIYRSRFLGILQRIKSA